MGAGRGGGERGARWRWREVGGATRTRSPSGSLGIKEIANCATRGQLQQHSVAAIKCRRRGSDGDKQLGSWTSRPAVVYF